VVNVPNSNIQLIETARRRKFVLEKRRQGYSYPDIAEAAAEEFGLGRLPDGWDKRYAHKDVTRALRKVQADLEETAQEVRTLELIRLDALYKGVAADAEGGDTHAAGEARKIIKRRCRMLGIDEPEELDVTAGTDTETIETLLDALQDYPEARQAVAEVLDNT
jgi:hypothetical protein